MRVWVRCITSLSLAACSTAALAHHSFAAYDTARVIEVDGTVKAFQWTNPHSYVEVLVTNAKGVEELWTFQTGNPNISTRMGWRKDSIKRGDKVHVKYHPMRNGSPNGTLQSVTLPDGRVLQGESTISKPETAPTDAPK